MCNTAPNNVVAANVGKDVTVIYQADGKRAHIPSVRNDGIVVIAGKITINIAVVIRVVDVESVSIACTIRFAVVNFFAVAAVSNRPNLVAITSAPVMTITSRGQFPGSLTLSCMRTIAYYTQNLHKNVTKAKNTARMQKLPAADDESAAGRVVVLMIYIRPVSGKNKPAILE